MTESTRAAGRRLVAPLVDLLCVVVFVLIGRRNHHEDPGFTGFLAVAWPFAVGVVVASAAAGLARLGARKRAFVVWLGTVVVGMVLRIVAQGHEFKIAFVIVATVFLGATMLGWRFVAWRGVPRLRERFRAR